MEEKISQEIKLNLQPEIKLSRKQLEYGFYKDLKKNSRPFETHCLLIANSFLNASSLSSDQPVSSKIDPSGLFI